MVSNVIKLDKVISCSCPACFSPHLSQYFPGNFLGAFECLCMNVNVNVNTWLVLLM